MNKSPITYQESGAPEAVKLPTPNERPQSGISASGGKRKELQTFHRRALTDSERFNEGYEIRANGCWVWVKSMKKAYGQFWMRGRNMKASRASWILNRGQIPEGMFVCHRCDNPPCVNPDHLFIGTALDNTRDMFQKKRNRHLHGEECGNSKLTEEQVREIRNYKGMQKDMAKKFNIGKMQVSRIVRGLRWRHSYAA